ncbi:MAG TPA: hypothetical protein VGO67_11655 [Verrucomicrobiae bacterium]|jgi:hypothetical protein
MSVQEIKEAVRNLNAEERAEIAAHIHSLKDDAWDRQIKRDLVSGKLDKILAEVDSDIVQGRTREMP